MHKQTIKDALFWTVILFNTVLEVPDGMSMPAQIFGAGIQEVCGCCDASGEGFSITAYKIVSGVRVCRDFRREDGEYFISEEYIPESEKRKITLV